MTYATPRSSRLSPQAFRRVLLRVVAAQNRLPLQQLRFYAPHVEVVHRRRSDQALVGVAEDRAVVFRRLAAGGRVHRVVERQFAPDPGGEVLDAEMRQALRLLADDEEVLEHLEVLHQHSRAVVDKRLPVLRSRVRQRRSDDAKILRVAVSPDVEHALAVLYVVFVAPLAWQHYAEGAARLARVEQPALPSVRRVGLQHEVATVLSAPKADAEEFVLLRE